MVSGLAIVGSRPSWHRALPRRSSAGVISGAVVSEYPSAPECEGSRSPWRSRTTSFSGIGTGAYVESGVQRGLTIANQPRAVHGIQSVINRADNNRGARTSCHHQLHRWPSAPGWMASGRGSCPGHVWICPSWVGAARVAGPVRKSLRTSVLWLAV
jgi:hypothetical protein